ncbi:MAG: hypothetical protein J5940_03720, partial [Clostridia bacterium]|nr:hypothetical protein [Clostridia bacterium]
RGIYLKHRASSESKLALSNELADSEKYLSRQLGVYDSCFICSKLNAVRPDTADVVRTLFGAVQSEKPTEEPFRIAFVTGKQANAAFERFAKYLGTVSAVGVESFSDACDAASEGEADYCIVPLENSSEGRLDGFYNAIGKSGLYPVLGCRLSDGYEYTRFALCCRTPGFIAAEGETIMQIRITAGSVNDMTDILTAAEFFGASAKRLDTIPLSAAGRENSLDLVFGVSDADAAGFITFLRFEYPQFYLFGIYTDVGEGEGK